MDRPAWQALTVAFLSNGVNTVIIEKLDRLARDLMVQESVIASGPFLAMLLAFWAVLALGPTGHRALCY
jgi:hypothetical protein